MTVKQLLSWVAYAHDRHDCSFDEIANKHTICLKQALLDGEPKIESHGYSASEGEREMAIVLIHTCNYQEVCDMENNAYDISRQPMNIETRVHRTPRNSDPVDPIYFSTEEAIRQSEARRAFDSDVETPTLHNTTNNQPPSYEPTYMPPMPTAYLSVDTGESPLRALNVEESRVVLSEALASYTQPAQGATVPEDTQISEQFERFFARTEP